MTNLLTIENKMSTEQVLGYNRFLIETGYINDYIINNIVLFTMCSHDAIKNVKLFVDRGQKKIDVLVFLSRWDLFWKSKKIYHNLKEALGNYLAPFIVNVNFDIYRKEENDRTEKRKPDSTVKSGRKTKKGKKV